MKYMYNLKAGNVNDNRIKELREKYLYKLCIRTPCHTKEVKMVPALDLSCGRN